MSDFRIKLPRKISKDGRILKMMAGRWLWCKPTEGDKLQMLFHAIETETCPCCGEPLQVQTHEKNGFVVGADYTCPSCHWESGFCTPAPARPDILPDIWHK